MPMVDMSNESSPMGLIPGVERQVFSWIADQFSLNEIKRVYHIYPSSDLMFQALSRGEIDVTSLFFGTGSSFHDSQNNLFRRRIKFRPACSIIGDITEFVVRASDSIHSVDQLRVYMAAHPGMMVATANGAMAEIISWPLRGLNCTTILIEDTNTLLNIIATNFSFVTVVPPEPFSTENYTGVLERFESGVISPTAAFFRRDKVYPCDNKVLETVYQEQCEVGDPTCTLNCTCATGYQATEEVNELGCKVISTLPVFAIVCIALGALASVAIVVAVVAFATIPFCRKRSYQEGATRMRGALFYTRRSSSQMSSPLTTDFS
eukprot:TRINITY_DN1744_c0_g1_i2.p1 TRINITY_DN1744_c0_g1~~TRINITY_DN1744_c0_g1_i2.p1  ORF type:complete len:336 (+),score=55.08 TRINITY_DN1744_c0_g1_i2:49-1008(+)